MDLPKLGIIDTYLSKPKWLKKNKMEVLKGECFQKDIQRLEDYEGVRKNIKKAHLGKKMRKK